MVSSPVRLFRARLHLRRGMDNVKASIIIPSLDRQDSLDRCLLSLNEQTETSFEVIVLRERGPLARIRNEGLRQARGAISCFIDDDVQLPPTWLSRLLHAFEVPRVIGVSGPAIIPASYQRQRDLFRYPRLKSLHDWLFLESIRYPGTLSLAGCPVILPYDTGYQGEVQFLEACNMSFRTEALRAVGGFDEGYGGIGDWSEPDVCFRLRARFPESRLLYQPECRLLHLPDQTGAYLLRRTTGARLTNYYLFAQRWVRPHWRHTLYKGFLRSYYTWKELCAPLSH